MIYRLLLKLLPFIFLIISDTAFAWKIEADTMVVNNTTGGVITRVNFRQTYDSVPLVFTLATDAGADPSTLRIINVSTTGFDVYSVEPDGNDGPHAQMSAVPYIAIEAGNHTFPDGTNIIAGTVSTQSFQSSQLTGATWQSVGLSGFSTTPTILGQIQTSVNERTDVAVPTANPQPWITTTIDNVSSGGFDIALDRSETTSGTLTSNETIAYLAIDSGLNGGNHYFGANNADRIDYETIQSSVSIAGWDNSATGFNVNFAQTYSNPIAVATKNSRIGGDGGWLRRRSISGNNIALVVDEDIANDTERSHTNEQAGVLVFSEPFDANFIFNQQAELIINEVMYNETSTGLANDEFVELYVTTSGNLLGTVIADQDTHSYTFPSQFVNAGDYVIYYTGTGSNNSSGGVHSFYQGVSNIWNNTNDDVILLMPAQDVTTLADGRTFNAIPSDYVAYGRSSVGSNVDAIPTSLLGTTISWNYSLGTELAGAGDGESIALTPNATDSNQALCWEITASGNGSNNGCSGYITTVITNPSFSNSLGASNTSAPIISLAKTLLTIYDPYNGASNPKAIPGSVLEYTITAKNDGDLAVDNNTISIADQIPNNTKLCVATVGSCLAPYFVDGAASSALSLGSVSYLNSSGGVITASPDAEGADSNVDRFDASMLGSFAAKTGATTPSFDVKFRVIVE